MNDCSSEMLLYHNEKVTLSQAERKEMREKRDRNRFRLKEELKKKGKPLPREFKSQGSYAMKTMVQYPDKDYDIDDGSYFDEEKLRDGSGKEMSPQQVKQMVCDALDKGNFRKEPEVHKNCVRIHYQEGYHVDVPIYRQREAAEGLIYELASSKWERSAARDVTNWFEEENARQSPDAENGGQLRRIVRLIKKFARSRDDWAEHNLSGFGITKLVTDCFQSNADREDLALFRTMATIHGRLSQSLVVPHPTPAKPGQAITKGDDDARARFLRDRLSAAVKWLDPVINDNCTRKEVLKCWDKVFNTDFFSKTGGTPSSKIFTGTSEPGPTQKRGGGHYA